MCFSHEDDLFYYVYEMEDKNFVPWVNGPFLGYNYSKARIILNYFVANNNILDINESNFLS
jgi:hypothetical protein